MKTIVDLIIDEARCWCIFMFAFMSRVISYKPVTVNSYNNTRLVYVCLNARRLVSQLAFMVSGALPL